MIYLCKLTCYVDPMLPPHLHKAEYMYQALKYIHLYPRRNQCSSVLGISSSKLHSKVLPTLHILAQCLDEIHWEDRLDPFNHTPDFPLYVTGIVDTVPVYVLAPQDSTLNHWLYNPKYGGTIYKAQIGTDFMGRIILFTGPHLGNGAYDGHILLTVISSSSSSISSFVLLVYLPLIDI